MNVSKKFDFSHSIVNNIIKGDEGHIWLGTQYGLLRFDGYKIRTYLHDPENNNSIISNVIHSIAKDKQGKLWIATLDGLSSYDPKLNIFENFKYEEGQKKGLPENKLADVMVDSKDRVWIASWSKGLVLYKPSDKSFTQFRHEVGNKSSLVSDSVRSITEDKDGYIWLGGKAGIEGYSGLHRLDPSNNSVQRYEDLTQKTFSFSGVNTVYHAYNSQIYLGATVGGLYKIDPLTAREQKIDISDETDVVIRAILETKPGSIWVGTSKNGLIHYDEKARKVEHYKPSDRAHSINGNVARALLKQKNHLWIANDTLGVSVLNLISRQFDTLVYEGGADDIIGQNPIFIGMAQDKNGGVWLANINRGLVYWDVKSNTKKSVSVLSEKYDLRKMMVQSLFVDSQDMLWIGTRNSGLYHYNPATGQGYKFSDKTRAESLTGMSIRAISEHPKGTIWIVVEGEGLRSIDIQTSQIKNFVASSASDLKTFYNINAIFVDSKGSLWLGTKSSGALEVNVVAKTVRAHKSRKGGGGISNNYVTGFIEDNSGNIWLSTDSGISKIERSEENKTSYVQLKDQNPFFKDTPVASLHQDKEGNIWFSYQSNLARYSPGSSELIHFDVYSGSLRGTYIDGGGLKGKDGELYFGGIGGVVRFDPQHIQSTLESPVTILDELFINNKAIEPNTSDIFEKTLSFAESISLDHTQSHFGFSFSTDQTMSNDSTVYRYRMKGYDREWLETDDENRRASYTNLDPGEYVFQVQANNNGLWTSKITDLNITIIAAPWLSWWAYTLYSLIVFSIVGNIVWQRYKIYQEMKLKAQAIAERNKQLSLTATLFQNTSEGVWLANSEFRYLAVNSGFKEISGFQESEVLGEKICIEGPEDKVEGFGEVLLKRVKDSERWQGEVWNKRKNGEFYPMEIVIDKISIENEESGNTEEQYVGVFSDITQRRRAEEELRKMASFDSLTELPNRNQFQTLVQANIRHCETDNEKASEAGFFILFIDLDNFKNINDSLGHSPGDEVLVYIANKLEKNVKQPMMTARLGGDEFAILVPPQAIQFDTVEFATGFLENTLNLLRDDFVAESFQFHITASIGVAIYPNDGDNYADLARSADTAMYEAKSKGRDQGQFYAQDMNQRAIKRLEYENELGNAIEAGEIQPFFQAKANFQTGDVEGLEVLARWTSAKLGWVSPEVFIALAEETNRIDQLSDHLLKQACLTIAPFIESGHFKGRMAFNLSAAQFEDENLLEKISAIIEECSFPAAFLELEVTESLMMSDTDNAITTLSKFRELGISVALDDFGTGYSSLSYLKQLPLDVLKVDRSFIMDIATNPRDNNMVTSIVNLSHDLDLKVVAEGVEDFDQVKLLQAMGCDILQGYYLSRPLNGDDYRGFITQAKNLYTIAKTPA